MRPTAIALNYSVKDIRHDVQQIIYIYIIYHEKSQLNRPVWGSLTPAPIEPVPLAVSQACGDCVGCSCYVTIAYLLCKDWITLSFHKEPCPVPNCHFLQPYIPQHMTLLLYLYSSLHPPFYHLSSSASLYLLFPPQLFIPLFFYSFHTLLCSVFLFSFSVCATLFILLCFFPLLPPISRY